MFRILLIEDQVEDSLAVQRYLSGTNASFELSWCQSMDAGFESLKSKPFDCVLIDYFLEGATAHDFLATLRADEAFWYMPVIVYSGILTPAQAVELIDAGASDFIHKDGLSGGSLWFTLQNSVRVARRLEIAASERRDLERTDRGRESLLQRVFSGISDAVVFADSERRVQIFNAAAQELFGYTEEEVIGQKTAMLYASSRDFDEQGAMRYNEYSGDETERYATVRYRKANGESFPAETIGGALRSEDGSLLGFIGIIRDMSDTIARRAFQREYARRLELSNTFLEEFGHATSHSLRTPIQGMCRLVAWLEEELREQEYPLSADAAEYLRLLQERGELLDVMMRELRSFVRAGEFEIKGEVVEMAPILEHFERVLGPNYTLHYEGPEALFCTPKSFQTLLTELIMNARHHHDRQEGNVWLEIDTSQEGLHFSVEDDGPGIEARYHSRIFRLYETLASKRDPARIGVGLAIVKRILIMVGGSVHIESPSSPDGTRGARFVVSGPSRSLPDT